MRILLVEDEFLVGFPTKALLERAGHEVLLAMTGEEAMAALHSWHPEAVLMDLRLGAESGLELTRRMVAEAGVAVWALTAARGCEQEAEDAGARGVLYKPIEIRQIERALAGAISGAPWAGGR